MTTVSPQTAIYPDLAGRTVLVSGGATGIGQTLVQAFAQQGAITAFVDINKAAGVALEQELTDAGFRAHFFACDITQTEHYQSVITQIGQTLGPITVLLNNAANDVRHALSDITVAQVNELTSVNLTHALFAAQSVAPMMKAVGGGAIINFGSVGWMMANAGYPIYAACKAAMHGMTRGLARELGSNNIRVNTLVPGWVMTDKQQQLWVDDEARALIKRSQCLPGYVLGEHIAQMALFLASDASRMCTAQNFIVDGGWV